VERRRAAELLPAAILVAVGAAYLWEIVSLWGIPIARDVQMFFVPQRRILWEAYQAREVPLWTPFIGTGAPFLANLQSGFFYPPHWLLAFLPFYAAFDLLIVFHFTLGGVFAFFLCRRLGLDSTASFIGAATWMLGGYFASLLNLLNALQAGAWVPGIAWAALRAVQEPGRGRIAGLVLVGVCAVLAGEPQSVLLGALCTALVVGFWCFRERPSRERLLGGVGAYVVASLFIVGFVLAQALPTLEFLRDSGRGSGLSLEQAAAFDLKPERLIYLFVPTDFRDPEYAFGLRSIIGRGDPWLFSIYLGAFFPLLFGLACRGSRRLETVVWTGAALSAIVIGLGDHTPVFPWLFERVPGLGAFRFPEKYFLVVAFAAMLIAAFGAEEALTRRRHRGDLALALCYVGVPLGLLAFVHLWFEDVRRWALGFGNARMAEDYAYAFGLWNGNLWKWALFATIGVLLVWVYRREKISSRWFGLLLCALVAGDLAGAHRHLNPVASAEFYEAEPAIFEYIPIEDVRRDYRYRSSRFDELAGTLPVLPQLPLEPQKWYWQQILGPNVGQSWGILQQDAWDAIKLSRTADERELHRVLDLERRWKLLQMQSVRYVYSVFPVESLGLVREIRLDSLPGSLYELNDPLPRAYVVPTRVLVGDQIEAINRVLDPDFDLRASVVITDSTGHAGEDAGDGASGDEAEAAPTGDLPFPGANIVDASANRVVVALDEGSSGYLVLTDSYYPGWSAHVDGERRDIELANYFFRAVELRPGDREVVFTFRSSAFDLGVRLSLLCAVLGAGLWIGLGVRDRLRAGGSGLNPR